MPYDKKESSWLRFPKIGESYDFTVHGKITEIKKVEGGKGFNFRKKEEIALPDGSKAMVEKDLGYRYEIFFEDGKKLSQSDWASFFTCQKAEIAEGFSMKVSHPEKGKWIVEKI